jgi:CheY-like chemotaxis protein
VGASVTVANNGREAVDVLTTGPQPPPFDVVRMDLQMPVMDGYQATARLRAEPRLASLPIIAMTAHATIEERQRCLAAGMNDHIAKPIDPASLYHTVERFYAPAERSGGETPPRQPATGEDPARSDPSDLPVVADLDTASGLTRVGGNRKLYLKLLREFAEQQEPVVEQIGDALSRGDRALAERLAHTLKGLSGSIGAARVQSAAGVLEEAIRRSAGDDEVAGAGEQVSIALKPLVAGLRGALVSAVPVAAAPAAAAPPANAAESKKAATELLALLTETDPTASDFLAAHQSALRPLFTPEDWQQFERLLDDYSFAEAQARLEQALQRLAAV